MMTYADGDTTFATSDHTTRDHTSLIADGVNPDGRQPRENPIRCHHRMCDTMTWHLAGCCDVHYQRP